MRLFFIALVLSALATYSYGQESLRDTSNSGSQPMRSSRFDSSGTQDYMMRRARADSEHRAAMLRYYDSIGFNYGSPLINGGSYFNVQAPIRYRRVFWMNPAFTPAPYGM